MQQQGNAYEQAATQRIRELEESNKNIYDRARQQEAALRARLVAIEKKELERAHPDYEKRKEPPMPVLNQPPASAQTSQFEPTDSSEQNPCPAPEVDCQAQTRGRSRPPIRSRKRTLGPPKVNLSQSYSSCDGKTCCPEDSPGGNVFSARDKEGPSGGPGSPDGGGGGEEPPPPPPPDDKKRQKNPSFKAPDGDDDDPDDDDPDDDDEWDYDAYWDEWWE